MQLYLGTISGRHKRPLEDIHSLSRCEDCCGPGQSIFNIDRNYRPAGASTVQGWEVFVEFELQKKITEPMRDLIALSDEYMNALYPAESNHLVDLDSLISENFEFYLLSDRADVVGCIAIRRFEDYAEIKRMFVKKEFRGLGHGRRLLEG